MENEVFISYKAEEIEEASRVKGILEANGISCWMAPDSIAGGESYAVAIPRAIKNCKVLVLILSEKSQSSRWVAREIDLAINEGKLILPFAIDNAPLKDDFSFYLANVQYYYAYINRKEAAEKMVREVRAHLRKDSQGEDAEQVIIPQTSLKKTSEQKISKMSVAALVLGIVSIVFFGMLLVPNIAAMLLAYLDIKSRKAAPKKGAKLALTGFILGVISLVLGMGLWFNIPGVLIALAISALFVTLTIKVMK